MHDQVQVCKQNMFADMLDYNALPTPRTEGS